MDPPQPAFRTFQLFCKRNWISEGSTWEVKFLTPLVTTKKQTQEMVVASDDSFPMLGPFFAYFQVQTCRYTPEN